MTRKPPLVKICGLSTAASLAAALDAGADMVGFVFFGPSPRNISLSEAEALGRLVKGRAKKVALTVDADDARSDVVGDGVMSQVSGCEQDFIVLERLVVDRSG